jgi:hypothetical protein
MGSTGVEDEISHYVRNDKDGAWVLLSDNCAFREYF